VILLRNFSYDKICNDLLTKEIVPLLTQIHEYKGKQDLLANTNNDFLMRLTEIAKIKSIDTSNRIEGISTSDERLQKLVKDKTRPRGRGEEEIAGYRDVLATINESYEYIPPKANIILQLHRDLYRFSGKSIGGSYKTVNNVIEEEDDVGNKFIRFQPLEAWETPEAMENICVEFENSVNEQSELLIAIPAFILDFLCIHPFSDGNGRMSRLLTLLLLYRAGYTIGKYISIEMLIERSKEEYYEVLEESSQGWHEEKNDYMAFVKYILEIILGAYREFDSQIKILDSGQLSKAGTVRETIKDKLGKITKREILEKCPDISQITVERALSDLLKNGYIIKIGGGRYTEYTWNREKE
jgi:Fic family protein